MAPLDHRRPGFSRRAHLGIFAGYLLAIVGMLGGVALIVLAHVRPGALAPARAVAAEIAAPVGAASAALRRTSRNAVDAVSAYIDAGAQNARLRREVDRARVGQVTMQAVAEENRRLKALLGLVDREGRPVAVARLIGSSAGSARRLAVLGAGWRDGVRAPMPVRSARGLVGRVLEVGPDTARVLLITDRENLVPVRRARDGVAAFSTGGKDGRIVLKLINMGINPLRPGDVFVTSGAGGLYRPNVPVGIVERLTRDGAVARLVEDPAAAEFVIVDRVFQAAAMPAPQAASAADPGGDGAAPGTNG